MKVKIIYVDETSDHDGYCSDGECEYKKEIITRLVAVPEMYKNHPPGVISKLSEFDWTCLLKKPNVDDELGSLYCDLSPECEANGLIQHDYRQTVIYVEIVDK